jgi:hypothetical protein
MASSKPTIASITNKGKRCISDRIPEETSIAQEKPASIFNKQCPDITFANNRRARLITRKLYDTNSMITRSGDKTRGEPGGKKSENILKPCFRMPTILIARKARTAIAKVTAM